MRFKWLVGIFLLGLMPVFMAFASQSGDGQFIDFINDAQDGSDFPQAISINNQCDYKVCSTNECALSLFNKTVFEQELRYVENKFGTRGRDWDLIGQDSVEVYAYGADRYYDDLGIQVVSTGEKKVIHFDITSPVSAYYGQKYSEKF